MATMIDALQRASEYNSMDDGFFYLVTRHGRVMKKRAGIGTSRNAVCANCPTTAHYPDQMGNPHKLCAHHAELVGSHTVLNPCLSCHIVDTKTEHNYICAGCDSNRVYVHNAKEKHLKQMLDAHFPKTVFAWNRGITIAGGKKQTP
jgi:hypothetical protein